MASVTVMATTHGFGGLAETGIFCGAAVWRSGKVSISSMTDLSGRLRRGKSDSSQLMFVVIHVTENEAEGPVQAYPSYGRVVDCDTSELFGGSTGEKLSESDTLFLPPLDNLGEGLRLAWLDKPDLSRNPQANWKSKRNEKDHQTELLPPPRAAEGGTKPVSTQKPYGFLGPDEVIDDFKGRPAIRGCLKGKPCRVPCLKGGQELPLSNLHLVEFVPQSFVFDPRSIPCVKHHAATAFWCLVIPLMTSPITRDRIWRGSGQRAYVSTLLKIPGTTVLP